jgi:hypothetical protein
MALMIPIASLSAKSSTRHLFLETQAQGMEGVGGLFEVPPRIAALL